MNISNSIMDKVQEIRQKAQTFRKQKRYSEAVDLYQALWTEHRDKCNEWEGWGYATCLRKLGKPEAALEICRTVYQIKPEFKVGKNLYAWCIYDIEIKKDNETIRNNEKNFFRAVNAILNITVQDEYSPYSKTILRVVDYLSKTKVSFPADDIFGWLEKLDENVLSKEPFIIEDIDDKQKEIPSEKEKCYSIKAKALEKLERIRTVWTCVKRHWQILMDSIIVVTYGLKEESLFVRIKLVEKMKLLRYWN